MSDLFPSMWSKNGCDCPDCTPSRFLTDPPPSMWDDLAQDLAQEIKDLQEENRRLRTEVEAYRWEEKARVELRSVGMPKVVEELKP